MHFDIVKHDLGFTIYLDGEKIAEIKSLNCNRIFFSCDFTENQIIPDHIADWGIAISGFGFFRPLYSNTFESQPKNVVRKYFEFQPK